MQLKSEAKPSTMIGLKTRHAICRIMFKEYPALETIYYMFEKIREVWISNEFFQFIYQISIKFWITNALLHKFFQTDMIFFDQLKVPTIKIGKCFAEFMIPKALLKKQNQSC